MAPILVLVLVSAIFIYIPYMAMKFLRYLRQLKPTTLLVIFVTAACLISTWSRSDLTSESESASVSPFERISQIDSHQLPKLSETADKDKQVDPSSGAENSHHSQAGYANNNDNVHDDEEEAVKRSDDSQLAYQNVHHNAEEAKSGDDSRLGYNGATVESKSHDEEIKSSDDIHLEYDGATIESNNNDEEVKISDGTHLGHDEAATEQNHDEEAKRSVKTHLGYDKAATEENNNEEVKSSDDSQLGYDKAITEQNHVEEVTTNKDTHLGYDKAATEENYHEEELRGSQAIETTSSDEEVESSDDTQLEHGEATFEASNHDEEGVKSGDRSVDTIGTTTTTIPKCEGNFFTPEDYSSVSQCYVSVPEGYAIPYNRGARLWRVPRGNLGELNTSEHDYHNQVHDQKWLNMAPDTVVLNENGGTSMRNFKTNFNYFDLFVSTTDIFSRCGNASKPVVLDTGAGVASLAASAVDERGGNGSISVISYVPVDNYLRLGTIISDRGLPVFLHWFSGSQIPVPSDSFDVVHCRWCWHHVVGYDTWLKEMDRIIVPGGAFVFTFVPVSDEELLPQVPWSAALEKMPWDCDRYSRIVQVCIKRNPSQQALPCSYTEDLLDDLETAEYTVGNQTEKAVEFAMSAAQTWHPQMLDRVLNMNCQDYKTCGILEEKWDRLTTINTFNHTESGNAGLRRLLQGGSVGLLHDWRRPGPFYPRFFDVINLMCGIDNIISRNIIFESHRLLRPDGFLVVLQKACAKFDAVVALIEENNMLFRVILHEDGIVVARKLSASH